MTTGLIPPDRTQCQHMTLTGAWPSASHFMNLGPPRSRRCERKPVVIVTENAPGSDGLQGSMSLCAEHWKEAIEAFPPGYFTATPI